MGIEIDGTVYSNDFEELHGRKPGDPAPAPVLREQPAPVTVYSTDYAAITAKPNTAVAETKVVTPAANPRTTPVDNVDGSVENRAKVVDGSSAPAR